MSTDFVPPPGAVTDLSSAGPVPKTPKLTAVARYTYTNGPDKPVETVVRFQRKLGNDQPITRHLTVGDDWVPVEHYWLDSTSLLLVENRGPEPVSLGRFLLGAGSTVTPLVSVPRGESAAFRPHELSGWLVRTHGGKSAVVVTIYPG